MKPILFNNEMVKANLDGRKNATRRLMKGYALDHLQIDTDGTVIGVEGRLSPVIDYAPYKPGDILYVRETWRVLEASYPPRKCEIEYRAGGTKKFNEIIALPTAKGEWKPSIHMPKKAARLFLRVTGVKLQRLQDITPEEAVAEGAVKKPHYMRYGGEKCLVIHSRYIDDFAKVWDSTVSKSDMSKCGWNANPWVWVIEFERISKEEAMKEEST